MKSVKDVKQIIMNCAKETFKSAPDVYNTEAIYNADLKSAAVNLFDNRNEDEVIRDMDLDITISNYVAWFREAHFDWLENL